VIQISQVSLLARAILRQEDANMLDVQVHYLPDV